MKGSRRRGNRGHAKGTPGHLRHRDPRRDDRAFVLLEGKPIHLSLYGTTERRAEYDCVVAAYLALGRLATPAAPPAEGEELLVVEISAAHREHAKSHYRHEDGTPTGELERNVRYTLRPLRTPYGSSRASEFGTSCPRNEPSPPSRVEPGDRRGWTVR